MLSLRFVNQALAERYLIDVTTHATLTATCMFNGILVIFEMSRLVLIVSGKEDDIRKFSGN
jgi:hypothetical protein